MSNRAEDSHEYVWLRGLKDTQGPELRRRYGAHAIGIGWKRVGGKKTDQLALIFYVERKAPSEKLGAEPIPPTVTFTPEGLDHPVEVATDVIESAPARSE